MPTKSPRAEPPPIGGLISRTQILIGHNACNRLQESRILLAGLGGVGAHAAEALARAGIGQLTLADHDSVEPTNLNRQLCALHSTLGQPKVEVMRARILDINPACHVELIDRFLTPEDMPSLIASGFDGVIDAIDSLDSKVALLDAALTAGTPIASSMGAGWRLDPGALRITDLMHTTTCPLARAVRQRLRKRGHGEGVLAVWSDEPPHAPVSQDPMAERQPPRVTGTISYMPALFGLALAGRLIQTLLASATTLAEGVTPQ